MKATEKITILLLFKYHLKAHTMAIFTGILAFGFAIFVLDAVETKQLKQANKP